MKRNDCCNKLSNYIIQKYIDGGVAILCNKCNNIIKDLSVIDIVEEGDNYDK